VTIYKGSTEGNFVLRAVEGGFDAPGRSGFEAAGRVDAYEDGSVLFGLA
jgi:hypothetical protein